MSARRHTSWWLEIELCLLVSLVVGVYFSRITSLTIRGEESRRGRVAYEMLETGDWIVPRQQGEPFLSRPPLQNWLIALGSLVTGEVNPLAVRMPSVLATLLVTILVYGYARTFLPRLGAFAAGAGFATMGHVLELGRLGETEATLTLLISGSLLIWHMGYARGWSPTWTWVASYAMAALGALAKGLQAPIYFVCGVWLYLIVRGDWRHLVTSSHLYGILVFGMVLGTWQFPFFQQLGWGGVQEIWLADVALRFVDTSPSAVLTHLATYPFEIWVSILPWSLLLLCFLTQGFWQWIGEARPHVHFLVTSLLVAFPSVWLAPGARPRYFMPLYPCAAVLIGLVVQRCYDLGQESHWGRAWDWYVRVLATIMVVVGLVVLGTSLLMEPSRVSWAQPRIFALAYAFLTVAMAGVLFWARARRNDPGSWLASVLAVAIFLGVSYTGVVVNKLVNSSVNTEALVVKLKEQLPKGYRLVSLGAVHHLFAFYHRERIQLLTWPGDIDKLLEPRTYFCFNRFPNTSISIPFPWEEVAVIPVSRYRSDASEWNVVVGRLLPAHATGSIEPGRVPP